jgi:hypothetical protein
MHLASTAFNQQRNPARMAITDMIVIAFYFLLRPGEYTGTTKDGHPFLLSDVCLYNNRRPLATFTAPLHDLSAATSVTLVFTKQKNGHMNEKLHHATSGHPLCCPVKAIIRRLLVHRSHDASPTTPLASYYHTTTRTLIRIQPSDVTDQLRHAAAALQHTTGIPPSDISARSLRAGGAMALLNAEVDHDVLQMIGRWHGDAMMRYLHAQCLPAMKGFARRMFNNGTYSFQPDETVPIRDEADPDN